MIGTIKRVLLVGFIGVAIAGWVLIAVMFLFLAAGLPMPNRLFSTGVWWGDLAVGAIMVAIFWGGGVEFVNRDINRMSSGNPGRRS